MLALSPAPVLTDGVVTLRAHTDADLDDMTVMATDPETVRWTTVPVPYERRHALEWVHEVVPGGWRDGTAFGWALEVDGRFAGNLDLRTGPPPDVGFAVAPWARGRGVTSRALRLAARWGFGTAGFPVLHWSAFAGHVASWRVAHACGFTFHGSRPAALPQRGALHDAWYASLRPGDPMEPRTPWLRAPVLEGQRARLRPHTEADLPRIAEACSDPRTRRWLPVMPHPYTLDTAREFLHRMRLDASLGHRVSWAVADRGDDRLLATVNVFRLDDPFNPTGGEVGYWAHPDARGRGVVSEAVQLAVAHAFAPESAGGLGRHRLSLGAAWTNTASRHVAERAGFRLVGHFHQDGLVGVGDERTLDDGAWYELLAADHRADR